MRECIAEYGPLVWSIVRRFSGPDSLEGASEAALLEIFASLWRRALDFDPLRESEPAFIAQHARRSMMVRRADPQHRPLRPVPETLVGEAFSSSTVARCAEASLAAGALAALDPRQRRVLTLAVGQGMRPAEIAAALGTPEAEVRSLVRRAVVAVRKRMLARREALG